MSIIERMAKDAAVQAAIIGHLRDESKQHKDAYLAMREENGILRQQLRGAVSLSDDEVRVVVPILDGALQRWALTDDERRILRRARNRIANERGSRP